LKENEQRILASYVITKLSEEDKTVRDPVHGDILWNHLETCVIDTNAFQRLRRIRQLGTVHFVFPGAEHSRFQHSLGSLHMAKILLQNVSTNRFSQYQTFGKSTLEDMTFRLVVRLAALLHDVHEFPLSHTLEKEGNIFPKQWKDRTLNVKMMGKGSEIYGEINKYIFSLLENNAGSSNKVLQGLPNVTEKENKSLAERLAKTLIILAYRLISNRKDKLSEIAQEFFGDTDFIKKIVDEKFLVAGNQIILNTICADLLDYLPRDFYFCGIGKRYDERFLKYAVIVDYPGKGRRKSYPVFAYRLISKRRRIKFSVLSSLFDVLELRCTLAEVVHTHRTKNAFSTMAIESFNFYYQSLNESTKQSFVDKMMQMGDDELLSYVREQHPTSKHILKYYFKRLPFNECVLWNYGSIEKNPDLAKALSTHIGNPRERVSLEKLLVEWLNSSLPNTGKLAEGDCLIYMMPDPNLLYKELNTNVIYLDENGNPKVNTLFSLTKIGRPYSPLPHTVLAIIERTRSQRNNLIGKYKNLWHTSLFTSPDIDYRNIQPTIVKLVENLFSVIGYNAIVESHERMTLLNEKLHKRLLTLSHDQRRFGTFEEILNSKM